MARRWWSCRRRQPITPGSQSGFPALVLPFAAIETWCAIAILKGGTGYEVLLAIGGGILAALPLLALSGFLAIAVMEPAGKGAARGALLGLAIGSLIFFFASLATSAN